LRDDRGCPTSGYGHSMRAIVSALPKRFRWTLHNMVAHPLSEICFQLGFKGLGDRVHDATLPYDQGE